MTIVSNSNMYTIQKCEKMFEYAVIKNLVPKQLPVYIQRGTFGHECAEVGINTLIAGGSVDDAINASYKVLEELLNSNNPLIGEIMGVFKHVSAFLHYLDKDAHFRPVATEAKGMWNITQNMAMPVDDKSWQDSDAYAEDRIFGYTPDLIIEFTNGRFKGQLGVLDYKFLSQYMKEIALEMAQQIPKYMIYRSKQFPSQRIRHGAYIQFNTRAAVGSSGHQLFLIKWLDNSITQSRLQQVEFENELLVEKVATAVENREIFLRTVDQAVCERCWFAQICNIEFNGKSAEKVIEREYKQNDYGYATPEASKVSIM